MIYCLKLEKQGQNKMKIKVLTTTLFIFLITVFLVIGLSHKKNEEQVTENYASSFKIILPTKERTLIPYQIIDRYSQAIIHKLFDNLFEYDESFGISGKLVSKWDIKNDNKFFSFELVKGVSFHNGKELTSDDVIFTLSNCFNGVNTMCSQITNFKKISKTSKYSLTVEFKKPFIYFLDLLTTPSLAIVPDKLANLNQKEFNMNPVGTGKYKVKNIGEKRIILTKNSNYFRGPAKVQELVFMYEDNVNNIKNIIKEDDFHEINHVFELLSSQIVNKLKRTYSSFSFPTFETSAVIMNQSNVYLKNIHMRKFLTLVFKKINFKEIFQEIGLEKATGFVPVGMETHLGLKDLNYSKLYNVSDLKDIYNNNLKDLSVVTFNLIMSKTIENSKALQERIDLVLKDYPKVKIVVKNLTKKMYYDKLIPRKTELALVTWVGDYPTPYHYLSWFHSKSKINISNIKDIKIDGFFEQVYGKDSKYINNQFKLLDKYIHENYLVISLFYPRHKYYYPVRIKGIKPNMLGINHFSYEKIYCTKCI